MFILWTYFSLVEAGVEEIPTQDPLEMVQVAVEQVE
jgi:hypothetical protein